METAAEQIPMRGAQKETEVCSIERRCRRRQRMDTATTEVVDKVMRVRSGRLRVGIGAQWQVALVLLTMAMLASKQCASFVLRPLASPWRVDQTQFSGTVTSLQSSVMEETEAKTANDVIAPTTTLAPPGTESMPEIGSDGIYQILSKEQHVNFLKMHTDKVVVIKFFAPWCRACKGLEPKYQQVSADPKLDGLPLIFAQLSVQHNKEYVKSLGVLALPSIHIYAGSEGLVENFPCGPSKVPILKRKLAQVINEKVDLSTKTLKIVPVPQQAADVGVDKDTENEPCAERPISMVPAPGTESLIRVGDVAVSQQQLDFLRRDIPFFKDLTDDEFQELMAKAKLLTFEPGSVIMRQDKPGRTFYVMDSGEVEIIVKAAFEDPLTTPSTYLGAVINHLSKNDYFGERSLITGQPRAASIRATEKTRCFAFDRNDIPASSILSGKARASSERLAQVDDKYGVDVYDIDLIKDQFVSANVANQARGSANTPEVIRGVDTDEELDVLMTEDTMGIRAGGSPDESTIINLLVGFKLIRQAARCFDYILTTKPKWGDVGEANRRSLLVSKLTPAQRQEFRDLFTLIDSGNDGTINLVELRRVMEYAGTEDRTDEELLEMINKADPSVDGNTEISLPEFMGVMAEAEFYHLFSETFLMLDKQQTGFVKASELDRVLRGMRDLISDDRKSIIDTGDSEDDMMIDYEQFSKMLLGTAL